MKPPVSPVSKEALLVTAGLEKARETLLSWSPQEILQQKQYVNTGSSEITALPRMK